MGQPAPVTRHLDKSLSQQAYRERKWSGVKLSVTEQLRQAGGDSERSEAGTEINHCVNGGAPDVSLETALMCVAARIRNQEDGGRVATATQ